MIGTGLFNPAVSGVALSSRAGEQSGLAAGVNDTFRQAGIAVGVAALGALIPAATRCSGTTQPTSTAAHRVAVGAAVCAVGAIAGWRSSPAWAAGERPGAAVPEAA